MVQCSVCQSFVFTNKDAFEAPKHEWCKAQGSGVGCSVGQFVRDVTGEVCQSGARLQSNSWLRVFSVLGL